MADFYSIAIGVGMTVVVCSIAFGIGALCAWLTKPRQNASDEHAEALGIGGGDFIDHYGIISK